MIEIETTIGIIQTTDVDKAIDIIQTAKACNKFVGYCCDYQEDNEYIWRNL